ncbi:hypothetical protein ES702_02955 [subsurface metagenome]
MSRIKSLSFCIPACGLRETLLERTINSIHLQKIGIPYAVLVYGKTNLDTKLHCFIYKHNAHDPENGRINSMFNRLAEMSRSEFLVYIGDDQELIFRWWQAVKQLNPDLFDLTPFPVYQFEQDKEPVEWFSWSIKNKGIFRKKWSDSADDLTYISTGCLIVRREVVLKIKFDESIGRGGDFLFSNSCFKAGYKLKSFPFMLRAYTIHYLAPAPYRIGDKKG